MAARRRLAQVPDVPPRAVLYLRQSTYREESISLELQETAGRDYCARMGYTVVAVEADPGISGRTWARPAVQRVMAMVEGAEADVVVLWRWSRLSRSRKDWAVAADRVDVAGGRIESATEPNDPTAAGRFARGVMTELAAFESERISEQWKEVHANRVARGLPPGGRLPWGWTWSDGAVVPDPDKAPIIVEAYRRFLAGAGIRDLTRWLNGSGARPERAQEWDNQTITQCLDSPVHAGLVVYQGKTHPGAHEGLVDVATWEAYRREREHRAGEREVKRRYLLTGIATCPCGERMAGFTVNHAARKRAPFTGYRCRTLGKTDGHGSWSIVARALDEAVRTFLEEVAADVDNHAPKQASVQVDARLEAQRIAREITALDRQLGALTGHLASGLVPEAAYVVTRDEIMGRRAHLETGLAAAERYVVAIPTDPSAIARGLLAAWDTMPVESCRAALRALVRRVDVDYESRSGRVVPVWEAVPPTA
ncbi:DNA-invertase hin [Oerskovia enterophila]|uniref:DNA-invertase hin n=2 Tax=Oerskovia enterophila TaxID=43678 RepID=A0A163QTK6_9CELL|nr:recombinase family protein [Oerskovia enterophila]KZM34511.1 DNA-invertase hin [Oerskovia enterophila]